MHLKLVLFLFSYPLIAYICIIISKKFHFVDKPSLRKIHTKNVINTGGIPIFIFYILVVSNFEINKEIELIIVYGSIIVFCGFIDDQFQISPGVKLFLIFIPSLLLIEQGFIINELGDYELIGKINTGKFNYIFTFLCIGLLVNAYNYLDGIDGITILTTIIAFFYFIFLSSNVAVIKILFIFIIPLICTFFLNILNINNPFKVFLGDGGSLFLGFLISALIIYLSKYENIHPAYLIWSVWLPIYDFLYVNIFRLKNKKKIYHPDKNHLHHLFFKKNKNQLKSTLIICLINIGVIFFGYITAEYSYKIFSLSAYILFFFIYYIIRTKIIN